MAVPEAYSTIFDDRVNRSLRPIRQKDRDHPGHSPHEEYSHYNRTRECDGGTA